MIEEIISHLSWFLKMIKLLVIFFIIKLSARNNILLNVFPKRFRNQLLGAIIVKFWCTKIKFCAPLYGIMFIKSMLSSSSDTAKPYSTIFNEIVIFLSLIVACYFNVLYKLCLVASMFQKSYCSHHISVTTFLRLTDNNWAEIWKIS